MADAIAHLQAGRTRIQWLSQLDTEYAPKRQFRRSSIICTIGPKTNSPEAINMLRTGKPKQYFDMLQSRNTSDTTNQKTAGLNVVRMNFSHGSYEYHQSVIDNAREAEKRQPGRPLAIALDTVSSLHP
jgi:pyruvate kinase